MAMREYQEQNNPEYKIEYGRALALESVLEMLGFDFEEVRNENQHKSANSGKYGKRTKKTRIKRADKHFERCN